MKWFRENYHGPKLTRNNEVLYQYIKKDFIRFKIIRFFSGGNGEKAIWGYKNSYNCSNIAIILRFFSTRLSSNIPIIQRFFSTWHSSNIPIILRFYSTWLSSNIPIILRFFSTWLSSNIPIILQFFSTWLSSNFPIILRFFSTRFYFTAN